MWGLFSARTAAIASATALFIAVSVLPLAVMLGSSLAERAATLPIHRSWLDARQRTLLYNTTVLGLWTAVLATLIGMPLGVALARIDLPWKRTLRVLLAAPMLLPPYIVALAWVSLGSRAGLLAQSLGRDVASAWIYSMPGAVVVLALVFYPLSMLATEVAIRRIEPHLEEAALVVASPGQVLWRITCAWRRRASSPRRSLIFVLAISEFGVPGLLRVRVFTTEVFTAFAAFYDFGRATLMAHTPSAALDGRGGAGCQRWRRAAGDDLARVGEGVMVQHSLTRGKQPA